MDYIHTLIMGDDLDAEGTENAEMADEINEANETNLANGATKTLEPPAGNVDPGPSGSVAAPERCICCPCRPIPQEIENKCCWQRTCISTTNKLCLDHDVLQLSIRNTGDIRNDREDNSTLSFHKAAYRQLIFARHGHLGKGNHRVCPSCVVLKIRAQFPSVTGVYMGYSEH